MPLATLRGRNNMAADPQTRRTRPAARLALAAFISSFLAFHPAAAAESGICEREIARAAEKHGVPLGVLYAVGLTETGRKGSLHPYALNIAGKTVFAESPAAAIAAFQDARKKGIRLIDLGCMQINHHYHGQAFANVGEMLVPARNIDYAANFLNRLRVQEGSWTMAVARYHAGPDNDPAQKRYVCAVIRNLVATGFGAWTRESRAFCGND